MKPERLYMDFLRDMLMNAEMAMNFIEGISKDGFIQDEKTIFAVIRALEIVGEASKKIPFKVKGNYPQVPWREITGMRDKLIHDYFGVNPIVLWKTVN